MAALAPTQRLVDLQARLFDTFEELINDLNEVGELLGFGIVTLGSSNPGADGELRRHDLCCERGRNRPNSSTARQAGDAKRRNHTVRRMDCPWKAKACKYKVVGDKWVLSILDFGHNHSLEVKAGNIPVHRRRKRTKAVVAAIVARSRVTGCTNAEIAAHIRAENPGIQIEAKDVVNVLRLARKKENGGQPLTGRSSSSSSEGEDGGEAHDTPAREGGDRGDRSDQCRSSPPCDAAAQIQALQELIESNARREAEARQRFEEEMRQRDAQNQRVIQGLLQIIQGQNQGGLQSQAPVPGFQMNF